MDCGKHPGCGMRGPEQTDPELPHTTTRLSSFSVGLPSAYCLNPREEQNKMYTEPCRSGRVPCPGWWCSGGAFLNPSGRTGYGAQLKALPALLHPTPHSAWPASTLLSEFHSKAVQTALLPGPGGKAGASAPSSLSAASGELWGVCAGPGARTPCLNPASWLYHFQVL